MVIEINLSFLGLPMVGKTSIIKVLFSKIQPHELIEIEQSNKVETIRYEFNQYFNIVTQDIPGSVNPEDLEQEETQFLKNCSNIIFVMDYKNDQVRQCQNHFKKFYKYFSQQASIHILLHQSDTDFSISDQKHNQFTNLINMLEESGIKIVPNKIFNYVTSIYD